METNALPRVAADEQHRAVRHIAPAVRFRYLTTWEPAEKGRR